MNSLIHLQQAKDIMPEVTQESLNVEHGWEHLDRRDCNVLLGKVLTSLVDYSNNRHPVYIFDCIAPEQTKYVVDELKRRGFNVDSCFFRIEWGNK